MAISSSLAPSLERGARGVDQRDDDATDDDAFDARGARAVETRERVERCGGDVAAGGALTDAPLVI